jgi:hypothetical protein
VISCLRSLEGRSPAEQRNCLTAAVATITCLRPSERARLQVCDFTFSFDMRFGTTYALPAALNVMCRKNDQNRKGHHHPHRAPRRSGPGRRLPHPGLRHSHQHHLVAIMLGGQELARADRREHSGLTACHGGVTTDTEAGVP